MGKLAKEHNTYACALAMPTPYTPKVQEWVNEIARVVDTPEDIILVGHSLGVPAVLHYLVTLPVGVRVGGIVLVSGLIENVQMENSERIANFFEKPFDFEKIKNSATHISVIHGDNDNVVPFSHAEKFATNLECELISVKNGLHLSGGAGWFELPEALTAVLEMVK